MKQHTLIRAANVIDIYCDSNRTPPKTIEYEFGNRSQSYAVGDTLILCNSTRPNAVSARICKISVINRNEVELLPPETIAAIGAESTEHLSSFIKSRDRGAHQQDTLLELDNIQIIPNPHLERQPVTPKK